LDKKVILSGIQSTGNLTLGNYLGAINNWKKMQEDYNCYYMIANLHTLTVRNDPETLRSNTLNLLALYLAAGINPEKSSIFIQSQVPSHAELSWVLNCYTYMGELSRMTQFKDKSRKHADNINMGLMNYPVLMASDILLYQAHLVPIGKDQTQHLEITRDIAERFNGRYSDTFVVPEALTFRTGASIKSLQDPTAKMSKSDPNENATVTLFDDKDAIRRKLRRAVTDCDTSIRYGEDKPAISNLLTIYSLCSGESVKDAEKRFDGQGYGTFKDAVADSVISVIEPIQTKQRRIIADKSYLEGVLKQGAEQAERIARKTLDKVYRKVGLVGRFR